MRGATRTIAGSGRGRALIAAAVAGSFVLAGCATTVEPAASGVPSVEKFYSQKLSWGPCAPYATTADDRKSFADPKLDCARLEVPIDYANPDGPTAQLGLLRYKGDQTHRIGSVVTDPGGPGGSGMELAANLGPAFEGSPFDLVGFDPRGVGASTPKVSCQTDEERDADRARPDDPSPAGIQRTEDENKKTAQECSARSGGDTMLANLGTRDVARDLDVMRVALGDAKLTYLGYSYGTLIGTTYAEAFPHNVRAMVLDGVVDPTQNAADSVVAQYASFQKTFEAYAAACAAQADCPLGTDPAKATAVFQQLTRPLNTKPVPAADGTRKLSFSDATTGVVEAMYTPTLWPDLTKGLTQLKAGDGTGLLALADQYYMRDANGVYANSNDVLTAVNCVDKDRITDRNVDTDISKRIVASAPFLDDGLPVAGALDACAFWPVPPTSTPHVPHAEGLPQILVVSTTGDPATPYQAGVDVAKDLNAKLLTVEGNQHTAALQGNSCVDGIVAQYIVNLTLPGDGARCTITPAG